MDIGACFWLADTVRAVLLCWDKRNYLWPDVGL